MIASVWWVPLAQSRSNPFIHFVPRTNNHRSLVLFRKFEYIHEKNSHFPHTLIINKLFYPGSHAQDINMRKNVNIKVKQKQMGESKIMIMIFLLYNYSGLQKRQKNCKRKRRLAGMIGRQELQNILKRL